MFRFSSFGLCVLSFVAIFPAKSYQPPTVYPPVGGWQLINYGCFTWNTDSIIHGVSGFCSKQGMNTFQGQLVHPDYGFPKGTRDAIEIQRWSWFKKVPLSNSASTLIVEIKTTDTYKGCYRLSRS